LDDARNRGMMHDRTGRLAESPWAIPSAGWKAVLQRSWTAASEDNIGLVAAGVSFYAFLAVVPLLGAVVLSYGLIADPATVISNVRSMTAVMPADVAKLIGEQLMSLVQSSSGKKGIGVIVSLLLAIFGARSGAGSVITALNIAYEEREDRGFVRVNILALMITGGAVVIAIVGMIAIAALGHLEDLLPYSTMVTIVAGKLLSYALLGLVGAAGAAALYRFGPARRNPRWIWLTPGSVLTAALWLVLTMGFGFYVARFGRYDASYGSLGAVVVLLTWLYLSSYALLFGAELNSELERQTMVDTTAGPPMPLGQRGASAANQVAAQPKFQQAATSPAANGAPSKAAGIAVSRVVARVQQICGQPKVGLLSSALATGGLAAVRKPGAAGRGAALLGAAVLLSCLGRDKRHTVDRPSEKGER
jgi:membrane protein